MIHDLKHLEASKLIQLQEALPLIAILVGKADGELDVKELDLAKKIAHIRTYSSPEYLKEFYEEVEAQFDALIDKFNTELPEDLQQLNQYCRQQAIWIQRDSMLLLRLTQCC